MLEGSQHGPFCAITGTELSLATLYKTGDDSQIHVHVNTCIFTCILQFQKLLKECLNQRRMPKGDQIIKTLFKRWL